ncbi:MAG: hypothetical protein JRI23_34665, partial [Deltaproteobacteria bacterium]|nr:hypothetical protein [Deltaproteobacteria bacterium]MBW2537443.1 hypothetical protein [Deltaproteobacteria bacterium]
MKGKATVATLIVALAVAGAASCSAGDSENSTPTGEGPTTLCIPNEQVPCACPAGAEGVQSCLPDGSGYDVCNCDGTGGAGGGGPCGDNFCDQGDENCHTCPTDCGTCGPCDIAPKCPDQGAMIPPADSDHFTELDVTGMTMRTPEEIHQRLAEEVARGTDAVRVIAAAFAEEQPGEHPFVTELRQIFADHPEQAEAVRFELHRAGLDSPADYRAAFPVPQQHPDWSDLEPRSDEFPGGTLECGRPFLRLAVTRITVHDDQDGLLGGNEDEIYCIIQAEAQNGIELRITPI